MSLTGIVYESKSYDDFKVITMSSNGYIYKTKYSYNREFKQWLMNIKDNELINIYIQRTHTTSFMIIKIGTESKYYKVYIHPSIIPYIVSWISSEIDLLTSIYKYKNMLNKKTKYDVNLNRIESNKKYNKLNIEMKKIELYSDIEYILNLHDFEKEPEIKLLTLYDIITNINNTFISQEIIKKPF